MVAPGFDGAVAAAAAAAAASSGAAASGERSMIRGRC